MIVAVCVIGVWVLAVALALRTNHRLNVTPPPAPVDVLPETPASVDDYWTQARVDAEFRALTVLLSR